MAEEPSSSAQPMTSVRTIAKTQTSDSNGAPEAITADTLRRQRAEAEAPAAAHTHAYTPVQAQPMRNERYDGWPVIGKWLSDATASNTTQPLADNSDADVTHGDGTTIEDLSVQWRATHDTTYTVNPSTNDPLSFIARVNFALSGQNPYEAGTIQFTLPLNIFKDHSGADEGALVMSLPEDPQKATVFNYKRLDDRVVVTNVQKLPAGYQGYFDLQFTKVVPSEVVSGAKSDPLRTVLTVTTPQGNVLRKTSNSVDAVVNTHEEVINDWKTGEISEQMPDDWSDDLSLPSGFKAQDYIYVDWYTYAQVAGNQRFTLGVTDTPNQNDPYAHGIIIGSTIPHATISDDRHSVTSANVFGDGASYTEDGVGFYYHTYMAYPRDQFTVPQNVPQTADRVDIKSMQNTVRYTLTTEDTHKTTTQDASSTVTYSEYLFVAPGGEYYVYKWGVGPNGEAIGNNPSEWLWNGEEYDPVTKYLGRYPHALNDLAQGKAVRLSYDVASTNYTYRDTYDRSGNPKDPASYGKTPVDVQIVDDEVRLPSLGTAPLTAADYAVTSLRVFDPAMYSYTGSSWERWQFRRDPSVARPDIALFGKSAQGDWVQYGTASWSNGGVGTINLQAMNGASASGDVLNLPQGVTQWKMSYSTTAASIYTSVVPTITLNANDRIKALATKLMGETQTPQTDTTNTAKMTVSQKLDGETIQISGNQFTGADRLGAASQSVWMTKSGKQTGVDKTNQQVSMHYTANVFEASNQTTQSAYNSLVAAGVLPSDPGGTYYDLLPRNVRVDLGSIKADGLQSVRTVDNWRGSGRTMLIVDVRHTMQAQEYEVGNEDIYGERLTLDFNATYSWFDLKEDGGLTSDGGLETTLTNNIAYASRAPYLGTVPGREGEADDPTAGNNTDSAQATKGVEQYMTNLTGAKNPSVVYASSVLPISALTYAFVGLHKAVSHDVDGSWISEVSDGNSADGASVAQGGVYRYRLTYETAKGDRMRNLVLYDDLEQYVPDRGKPDHGKPQWHGTLLGVDTSDLQAKGIAPVVYYATQSPGLQGSTTKPDLTSPIWTRTAPADLSSVKAIAVDCSKTTNGGEFTLDEGQQLQVQLRMRAPSGDASNEYATQQACAYNNVYMSASNSLKPQQSDEFVHQDYTKIALVPFKVVVLKQWNDDNDRDGKRAQSISVQLTRNGKPYGEPVTLDASNSWKHEFENLAQTDESGNAYTWNAAETDVPQGYTVSADVQLTGTGATATLTNTHAIDTVPVRGEKTWAGEQSASTRPKSIEVTLYRDGTAVDKKTVTPGVDGKWDYDFGTLPKNHKTANGSVPYAYTVKEAYVEGYIPTYAGGGTGYGEDVAGATLDHGFAITNTYHPFGNISISKSASDVTDETRDAVFTFQLVLRKPNGDPDSGTYRWTRQNADGSTAALDGDSGEGTVGTGGSVRLRAGQTVVVHEVPSQDTYVWSEQDLSGFTIDGSERLNGTVTTGGTTQANVLNVYHTHGGVQLSAKKVLKGRKLGNMQFGFIVQQLDGNGNPLTGDDGTPQTLRVAYNDQDGNVEFGRIGYTNKDVGKTYVYRISEIDYGRPGYTYDATQYTAQVHVVDNADGTISAVPHYYDVQGHELGAPPTFTNTYTASGELNLTANKVFVGGDLTKRAFRFVITKDGKQVAAATTNKSGEAVFPTIHYTEADAGKTYEYTVSEEKDGADSANIIWDTHSETVSAQITDNGDGTLQVKQSFTGQTGSVPLVWTNRAQTGGLKLTKHLTADSATQAKRDTKFPMEVTLAVPKGADSFDGRRTAKVYTPTAFDANGKATATTESDVTVIVKNGRFRIAVPAEGWVVINNIPGGTSYLVTEVDSVTMPQAAQEGETR
ncbi:Cna B-type domain-containing protein [Bifidobacterium pseudolongum]|uniref:Cna B-type domain-containing protein n=1 Tax=Bifidobacterium pseudolongum TaxID=1694 RepID=UPI0013ED1C4A|nr:Cna B-type domain-containing protein [Bifidobacterium pseudolongum]